MQFVKFVICIIFGSKKVKKNKKRIKNYNFTASFKVKISYYSIKGNMKNNSLDKTLKIKIKSGTFS